MSGSVRYLDVVEGGVVDLVVVREAVDLARLEVDEHVVVAVERVDACGRPHPAPLEVLAADHARVDVRRRQCDRAHLCVCVCEAAVRRVVDGGCVPDLLEVEVEQLPVDRVQIRALLHPAALCGGCGGRL